MVKKSRAFRERSRIRNPKTTVLICCEGKETEPRYFNEFGGQLSGKDVQVEIIPGNECGTNPKNIVEYAKEKSEGGGYDHVFCVFDRNAHEYYRQAIQQANDIDQEREYEFKAIFSNPCFELWYLLHFQEQTAYIERDKACRKLRKHIRGYNKTMDVYNNLKSGQIDAIKRAEKLRRQHPKSGKKEYVNPSTNVDLIVDRLNSLIKTGQD